MVLRAKADSMIKGTGKQKFMTDKRPFDLKEFVRVHFDGYGPFTFSDVFNSLKSSGHSHSLSISHINEVLSDLTHSGVFRRFSDEVGIHYYSSMITQPRSRRKLTSIEELSNIFEDMFTDLSIDPESKRQEMERYASIEDIGVVIALLRALGFVVESSNGHLALSKENKELLHRLDHQNIDIDKLTVKVAQMHLAGK